MLIDAAQIYVDRPVFICIRGDALGGIQSYMLGPEVAVIYTERSVFEWFKVVPYELWHWEAVFGELIELQHPRKGLIQTDLKLGIEDHDIVSDCHYLLQVGEQAIAVFNLLDERHEFIKNQYTEGRVSSTPRDGVDLAY